MPTATMVHKFTLNDVSHTRTENFTTDSEQTTSKALAVAVAGSLTTRTDNDTGVITVAAHSFIVSDKVAVGWTDASGNLVCRFYMNVSAQTPTTVTVDVGVGTILPAALTSVTIGLVTSEPYHIDPQVDTVDVLKPATAFAFGVGGASQAAAAFIALVSDVGGGTLSNGRLHVANGPALPAIVFATLGLWSSYPATPDRIYFAPLSVTATTVYAHSMFNA